MGIEERIRKGFYPLFEREPLSKRLEVLLGILAEKKEKELGEIIQGWPKAYEEKFKKEVVPCNVTDENWLLAMALYYGKKSGKVKEISFEVKKELKSIYQKIAGEKELEEGILKAGEKLWEIYEGEARERKMSLREYLKRRFQISI